MSERDLKAWARQLHDELDRKQEAEAPKVVELTAWRTDRHLRQFNLFVLKPDPDNRVITYQSKNVRIEAHGSTKGLPTVWDADILDFAISKAREICDSEAQFPRRVRFTRSEALRALGKDPRSGGNHKAFKDGLFRLAGTMVRTMFTDNRKFSQEEASTLISYKLREEEADDEIEVKFCSRIVDSIRDRNILADDPETAQMLLSEGSSGLRKQLIRLLSARFGKNRSKPLSFWQETLMELCNYDKCPRRFRKLVKVMELPRQVAFERRNGKRWQISFY